MENKNREIIKGIVFANLFAFVMMGITHLLINSNSSLSGIFMTSDFIVVPIVMGIINAYCWQNLKLRRYDKILYTFYNLIIVLLLAFLFMNEGIFCLIIVCPLIFIFLLTGAYIGKEMYEKRNNTLNVSIFGILFVVFVMDAISDHTYERMVSDEIIVNASPDKIWKHVVAFDPIKEEPTFWMFQLGMPKPMQTTVEAYCQGAGRKCIFNDKIIFDEKMVVFEPNKNLTFDIIKQPEDPEIIGHIVIQRGQFLLKDNGNGTTTLVGNSWYKLKVFPALYYDLWAESITRNVHLRVMYHIKKLSEEKNS